MLYMIDMCIILQLKGLMMLEKKRINLDINKELWIEIGVMAARADVSKTEMLNRLLTEKLEQEGVVFEIKD